jgi:hypothetical protein
VGEYSDRSNDPRITSAMKGFTKDDYHFALEVAKAPASTAWEKKQKKRAATYARAYESMFQKESFLASDRGMGKLSAGRGKNEYKDPEKVNMSTKDPFAKKPSTASKVAGAAGKVAGKAAGLAKSKVKADVKVAKKVAGVAGKVAGKAAGVAKSKVKADIKAAKTVAGVAGKVAGKAAGVAKAGAKVLAKKERPVTRQMYSNKNLKKK